MSTIDIIIIVAYVLFITWKGLGVAHTHNSTDDFFLANRSLSWPFIGLSLFATNISSSTIIGLSSSGYKTGISVFDYEWTGAIMLVIFAIFIVPLYPDITHIIMIYSYNLLYFIMLWCNNKSGVSYGS